MMAWWSEGWAGQLTVSRVAELVERAGAEKRNTCFLFLIRFHFFREQVRFFHSLFDAFCNDYSYFSVQIF